VRLKGGNIAQAAAFTEGVRGGITLSVFVSVVLTAGIAHEIKNPLHALKGTAEILKDVVPQDAPERRMLDVHRGRSTGWRRPRSGF
jgi:signal transduction histidine kinase